VAGCSGQSALTGGSANSCFQFAVSAIERHVTVTVVPPACQGLSQIEVNTAVDRALRAAVAGVRGKVGQRELIARDDPYVAALIHSVPAASPPAVTARPSRPPTRAALSLAALIAWLVTVGLGLSMLARWITRTRRHATPGRGPVLNFTHLGLALTGLLTWIGYLATGVTGLAWAGCGLLLAVASLGMALVFLSPASATAGNQPGDDPPPAGRPPVPVIAAHITAACVTILLATLAAIG
jgi:manganese efflux pump family protein